jgi:hypothetical protein
VRCCADAFKPVSAKSCGELGWSNARQFGSSTVCGESDDRLGGCSRWGSWEDANAFCAAGGARLCTLTELKDDEARATGCSLDSETLWSMDACGDNEHFVGMGSSTFGTWSACKGNSTPRKVRCCADTNTAQALEPGGMTGASRDPSMTPTPDPSATSAPSPLSPAPTHLPSALATPSPAPMHLPSALATTLPAPTHLPSTIPLPSSAPTHLPTALPPPSSAPTHLPTATVSKSSCEDLGWGNALRFGSSSVCGASKPPLKDCSGLLSWSDAQAYCEAGKFVQIESLPPWFSTSHRVCLCSWQAAPVFAHQRNSSKTRHAELAAVTTSSA